MQDRSAWYKIVNVMKTQDLHGDGQRLVLVLHQAQIQMLHMLDHRNLKTPSEVVLLLVSPFQVENLRPGEGRCGTQVTEQVGEDLEVKP